MCNRITVPPRTPGYLQTVDRALRVLGAFSADTTSWGVSELARFLRLDKSGVQRSLATLALRGFLVADPVTRRYHLGPALIGLGRLAEESDATLAQLRGLLAPLAQRTGESVVYNVLDANRYRCAAAVDGPGPLRYTTAVGDLYPGHGGASGHAIFAFLAESRVRTLFGATLERYSPSTPTTLGELLAIYAEVRRTGIATSHGEYDARVTAVAAPVFARGVVTGAISVIGPRESMRNHLDAVVPPLRRTAEQISALLTGPPPGEPHTTEGAAWPHSSPVSR